MSTLEVPSRPIDVDDDTGSDITSGSDGEVEQVEVSPEVLAGIVKQIEFYFSDANLPTDKKLLKQIKKDPEGYVPIKLFANFRKVRALTKDIKVITEALASSQQLSISTDDKRVKRNIVVPEYDVTAIQKRTVLVENLPPSPTIESVTSMFSPFGKVKLVRICSKESKGKLPNWLTSACQNVTQQYAFVEFENEDDAVLAVAGMLEDDSTRRGVQVRHLLKAQQDSKSDKNRKGGSKPGTPRGASTPQSCTTPKQSGTPKQGTPRQQSPSHSSHFGRLTPNSTPTHSPAKKYDHGRRSLDSDHSGINDASWRKEVRPTAISKSAGGARTPTYTSAYIANVKSALAAEERDSAAVGLRNSDPGLKSPSFDDPKRRGSVAGQSAAPKYCLDMHPPSPSAGPLSPAGSRGPASEGGCSTDSITEAVPVAAPVNDQLVPDVVSFINDIISGNNSQSGPAPEASEQKQDDEFHNLKDLSSMNSREVFYEMFSDQAEGVAPGDLAWRSSQPRDIPQSADSPQESDGAPEATFGTSAPMHKPPLPKPIRPRRNSWHHPVGEDEHLEAMALLQADLGGDIKVAPRPFSSEGGADGSPIHSDGGIEKAEKRRRRRRRNRSRSGSRRNSTEGSQHDEEGDSSPEEGEHARGYSNLKPKDKGKAGTSAETKAAGKKMTKKDYANWACATPEFREQATARFGSSPQGSRPPPGPLVTPPRASVSPTVAHRSTTGGAHTGAPPLHPHPAPARHTLGGAGPGLPIARGGGVPLAGRGHAALVARLSTGGSDAPHHPHQELVHVAKAPVGEARGFMGRGKPLAPAP